MRVKWRKFQFFNSLIESKKTNTIASTTKNKTHRASKTDISENAWTILSKSISILYHQILFSKFHGLEKKICIYFEQTKLCDLKWTTLAWYTQSPIFFFLHEYFVHLTWKWCGNMHIKWCLCIAHESKMRTFNFNNKLYHQPSDISYQLTLFWSDFLCHLKNE